MPLLNTANALYIGGTAALKAYQNGVQVWPGNQNSLSVSAAMGDINVPSVTVSTAYSGIQPGYYRYYYRHNGGNWVFFTQGGAGPVSISTSYNVTFQARVDSFTSSGALITTGYSNNVAVPSPPPPPTQQRVWSGTPVEAKSYYKKTSGSSWLVRSDGDGSSRCYYGWISSTWGEQQSQVRYDIPAEIRNCISVDRVEMSWYNHWHFYNSGGRVSMVAHHNPSLGSYGGNTQPLVDGNGQVRWSAPKPGQIGETQWYDLGWLTSAGRTNIYEEIRVNGLQGFGLVPAFGGDAGYGYAAMNPTLRITYTVYT